MQAAPSGWDCSVADSARICVTWHSDCHTFTVAAVYAALPGNFMVARPDESMLSAYNVLGWDPRPSGAVDSSFGLPMAAKASQMLAGMKQTASADA